MGEASARISEMRRETGLNPHEVAQRLGIDDNAYWDLEHYEDEAGLAISIRQLMVLASTLNVTVAQILGVPLAVAVISPSEVSALLRQALAETGGNVAGFEEQLGWSVGDILERPEALYDLNVHGFRVMCDAAGIDWRQALPKHNGA